MGARADLDASEVRARLDRARNDFELVSISRSVSDDELKCYVVALGEAWILTALLDSESVRLESFTALRIEDITEIRTAGGDRFVRSALELQGQWPPADPPVELRLVDVATIIGDAKHISPLLTIHPELDDPGICFIGVPIECSDSTIEMLDIDPQAEWDVETTVRSLKDITRIDVGGRYEEWLYKVGGPPTEHL